MLKHEIDKINKEQAKIEYIKILDESIQEENRIIQEAQKNGTWKMGLDSNRELFAKLHKATMEKIKLLQSRIEE